MVVVVLSTDLADEPPVEFDANEIDHSTIAFGPDGAAPSMFEPVHGSAPDIAGQNKANPIAAIDSIGLLLREVGRIKGDDAALKCGEKIGEAVQKVTPQFAGKKLDRSGYSCTEIGDTPYGLELYNRGVSRPC